MSHTHEWVTHTDKATGYWEKRDVPGKGLWFSGRTEICAGCGDIRFICDDKRYLIVDAEREVA